MELADVVLAVDFSPASLAAARWAARWLAPEADLTLVHCLEIPRTASVLWEALPPREKLVQQARHQAEAWLGEVVAALGERRVRTEILVGPAAEEIGIIARETGTDLVVTGDHQGPHDTWRLLGSTAEQLVANCHRPVLVGRGELAGPPRRLLVPVDESEPAAKALAWAASLANRLDAEVIAYHVGSDWYFRQVQQTGSTEQAQKVQGRLIERTERWLEELVAAHAPPPAKVRCEIESGRPRDKVLGAIERLGVDLVVVGSHGAQSVTGEPQKRLSRFLLVTAPCSVLVIA